MKEETKKSSRAKSKSTAEKKTTTTKKVAKKPVAKKTIKKKDFEQNLNETVLSVDVQKEVVINNDNLIECNNCHEKYEKGYTICPHCHKRQKTSVSLAFFIVFAVVFLFGIISFHFIDKYLFNKVAQNDYKDNCVLVDYENLVRRPKDYRGKAVKVIGHVVSVEGTDTGYGNKMRITINANLFDDGLEHFVTIDYSDTLYEQGFIEGDLITVYGDYTSINGNIPNINAKYIIFGK